MRGMAGAGGTGGAVEGCELARGNPYHRCSARCAEQRARRQALYGAEAGAEGGGPEGGAAAPVPLPGAQPVPRLAAGEAWRPVAGAAGQRVLPAISPEEGARCGWNAGEAWTPEELREAVGGDEIVCVPAVPLPREKGPTVRVKFDEFLNYLEGGANAEKGEPESPIAAHEFLNSRGQRVSFCLLDWSPFGNCPRLLEGWAPPGCVVDATIEESESDRRSSLSRYYFSFLPESGVTPLSREPRGLAQWFLQIRGRAQYVMFPPQAGSDVYGGESADHMSYFNPFAADYEMYPRARRARQDAHTGVLEQGQMLVVPSGWWVASRSLEVGLFLRRAFPTSPERARLLQGVRGGIARDALGEPSWAGATETCDDPDADIFERSSGYRARGNTEFGRGRYREACEAYTRAIGLLSGDDDFCFDEQPSQGRDDLAVLYSNRAACHLKLGRYSDAVEDCNEVLRSGRCDAIAVKALFRRGKAHEGLGDVKPAYRDFRQVVELEPNNVAALVETENYRSVLHRLIVKQRGTPGNREKKENLMSLV